LCTICLDKFDLAALLLLFFCASCDEGSTNTVCDPGATQSCLCESGQPGVQSCNWNGSGWDPCQGCAEQQCQPNCSGKQCGSNGCGGICGICDPGFVCEFDGTCKDDLIAWCEADGMYANAEPGCIQDPSGTACLALCHYAVEVCHLDECLGNLGSWTSSCESYDKTPNSYFGCLDWVCGLWAMEAEGNTSSCPD